MPVNIYILKLQDECWYVGKTASDVEKRVHAHMNGTGSAWTKLHKPIGIHVTFCNVSAFDEDKYTKEYMAKYGMDKVRGGTYVLPTLQKSQKDLIQKEIWGAQDRCFTCGGNHFVYKCNNKPPQDEDEEVRKKCMRCLSAIFTPIYNFFAPKPAHQPLPDC